MNKEKLLKVQYLSKLVAELILESMKMVKLLVVSNQLKKQFLIGYMKL